MNVDICDVVIAEKSSNIHFILSPFLYIEITRSSHNNWYERTPIK